VVNELEGDLFLIRHLCGLVAFFVVVIYRMVEREEGSGCVSDE
jgi:hypothetical protein